MNRYAVTLGVQYRNDPHPALAPEYSDPDGYLLVRADNERDARIITQAVIGTAYSSIYTEDEAMASHYLTKGCLGEIIHGILAPDVSEALSVAAFQKPEPSRG